MPRNLTSDDVEQLNQGEGEKGAQPAKCDSFEIRQMRSKAFGPKPFKLISQFHQNISAGRIVDLHALVQGFCFEVQLGNFELSLSKFPIGFICTPVA